MSDYICMTKKWRSKNENYHNEDPYLAKTAIDAEDMDLIELHAFEHLLRRCCEALHMPLRLFDEVTPRFVPDLGIQTYYDLPEFSTHSENRFQVRLVMARGLKNCLLTTIHAEAEAAAAKKRKAEQSLENPVHVEQRIMQKQHNIHKAVVSRAQVGGQTKLTQLLEEHGLEWERREAWSLEKILPPPEEATTKSAELDDEDDSDLSWIN